MFNWLMERLFGRWFSWREGGVYTYRRWRSEKWETRPMDAGEAEEAERMDAIK